MSSAFEGLPKTPNLKLNKPGYDNVADIEALNENADILDEEIQGIKNTFVKSVNGKEPDAGGNVNVANMTGASDSATGKAGLVPAPAAGMQNKFLCSDATWKDAGGLPVGHEFFTTNPNIPAGCIPLLGGEYSRTAYADLWAWVQTQQGYLIEESAWQAKATANGGNVPFYSKGDGTTTFRVPALKCWVRGAGSISEVGGYLVAGLPNITGQTSYGSEPSASYTPAGAFYREKTSRSTLQWYSGSASLDSVSISASLSNPIYGSSDTVQPPSIVGLWCVKAYGTVTNVGSTDVANISTGLTQAETRISALENHGAGATVVESYRNGTEWYRIWSDGWIEQGGYFEKKRDTALTVTFLKPYADTNYTFTNMVTEFSGNAADPRLDKKTATDFSMLTNTWEYKMYWRTEGKGA